MKWAVLVVAIVLTLDFSSAENTSNYEEQRPEDYAEAEVYPAEDGVDFPGADDDYVVGDAQSPDLGYDEAATTEARILQLETDLNHVKKVMFRLVQKFKETEKKKKEFEKLEKEREKREKEERKKKIEEEKTKIHDDATPPVIHPSADPGAVLPDAPDTRVKRQAPDGYSDFMEISPDFYNQYQPTQFNTPSQEEDENKYIAKKAAHRSSPVLDVDPSEDGNSKGSKKSKKKHNSYTINTKPHVVFVDPNDSSNIEPVKASKKNSKPKPSVPLALEEVPIEQKKVKSLRKLNSERKKAAKPTPQNISI